MMLEDRVAWLCAQLDSDEQCALAASRPPAFAARGCYAPPEGAGWQWSEHPHGCELLSVNKWPTRPGGLLRFPASYLTTPEPVDAAAAEHILRNDPRAAIGRVTADRLVVDLLAGMAREGDPNGLLGLRLYAVRYAHRPGYAQAWASLCYASDSTT